MEQSKNNYSPVIAVLAIVALIGIGILVSSRTSKVTQETAAANGKLIQPTSTEQVTSQESVTPSSNSTNDSALNSSEDLGTEQEFTDLDTDLGKLDTATGL